MVGNRLQGVAYWDLVSQLDELNDVEIEGTLDGRFVDFEIEFFNSKGSPSLGILPDSTDEKTLRVAEIADEGAVPEWNKENPNRMIVVNDRIIRMSGVEGNAQKLL